MTEMTQAEYARHIGKTKQYVGKLVRTGKLVLTPDGLLDSDVSDAARKGTADPARELAQNEAAGAVLTNEDAMSYTKARTQRELLKGQHEELKYRRAAGELVEVGAIESVLKDIFRDLRESLQGLPTITKGRLVSMVDEREIQVYLNGEIHTLLEDISNRAFEKVKDVCVSP